MRLVPWLRGLAVAALCCSLVGCVRGCTSSRPPIHMNPNMDWQPKVQAQEESTFFYDGSAMRLPIEGTVARGQLHEDEAFHTGKAGDGTFLAKIPLDDPASLRSRGAERYSIYCQPCHDPKGNGKGILYERGGVPTPSFHEERLRALPDGEIFDVITHGKGLMSAYGYPVPVRDRWAIIAHLRWLQEQHAASAGQ